MKKIREIYRLVTYNFKALAIFEVVYRALCTLLFIPLLWGAFDMLMKVSGYAYLTLENVVSFLLRPLTVIVLVIIVFLAAVCAMIEISAVVFTLDEAAQRVKVNLSQVMRFALKNALRVFNYKNISLVLVVLVLMPFLNAGTASGFLSALSIPEFIMDYIDANTVLSLLFAAVTIVLSLLMMRWLYAFHYFTLEGCSFRQACRKSRVLGRKRMWRDFFAMFMAQVVVSLLFIVFIILVITLVVLFGKLFSGIFVLRMITMTAVWFTAVLAFTVVALFSVPISYGCISALYYAHKAEDGEKILHAEAPEYLENKRSVVIIRRINIVFACLVVAGSLVLGYLLCSGKINPQIEYIRTMEVTAHRGASAFRPENTMAAFELAKEMGADWIELDVQQTKDGEIIVIHDTNLKRTTGVNANTWDMTYAEIAELDAGSFFDESYAGEKIPLLREVADFAKKNRIKLNIELKPTGYETDFEKCVVDIIKEAGIEDYCVITSQVYEVLENVKAYDKSVQTVYVMSLAYGDITRLAAADHFSVEATSATKSLISRVHSAGRQIFVWTVNTRESITQMAELNVDNIITDDVELAKECIYESRYSDLLTEYLKLLQ